MDTLPKNIKRIDKETGNGYKLAIRVDGKRYQKFFNDNKFGGSEGALSYAKNYLSEICEKHSISLSDREPSSELPGVSRTEYTETLDGNKVTKIMWQASWQSEPGKQSTKRFSVKAHGEEKAKRLAIEYREHAINAIQSGKDPIFESPKSRNSKLWRYMDFTKFASMLDNSGIYFAQADNLGDPYEGSYSRGNQKNRNFVYSRRNKGMPNSDDLISKIREKRQNIMISCWHNSKHESAAMWKLYAHSNEAVCVQTTFNKLERSVSEHANLGSVKYIDYDKNWIPENSYFYPFIYKRKSFEHEKEIRAIIDTSDLDELKFQGEIMAGYWQPVDLNYLITKIYVAPDSPEWFYNLTKSICLKYGLTCEIIKSPLDGTPIY